MGTENSIAARHSIEWPTPIINDAGAALDDVVMMIERLSTLIKFCIDEMQDAVVDRPCADEFQSSWASEVWMVFRLAAEKLEEIDKVISAIAGTAQFMPPSPVARHTQIRRSQDWRAAVAALDGENTSGDISGAAVARAARAFKQLLRSRVGSFDQLREKMEIMCSNAAFVEANADELFRDLDALGCRVQRAVSA